MRTLPVLPSSTRVLWIDFLRGLAVLGMIEAHSVNSFLHPLFRTGPWFGLVSYINGWVAPTFLFLAGYLQGASTRKNWHAPRPLGPRLRSLGVILAIGYGLQFPWDRAFDWAAVSVALARVDVLHCLAVTLAALLLLGKCCKRLVTYDWLVFSLTFGCVLVAPFVWQKTFPPNLLTAYLNPAQGALFPIFPWSALVLSGVLASGLSDRATRWRSAWATPPKTSPSIRASLEPPTTPGPQHALPENFALAALLTAALGWIVFWFLGTWMHPQPYATRYDTFLFRLSSVLASAAFCALLIHRENLLTRAANWCGSRSLPLYVWHLVLLHSGLGIVPPLRDLFPKTHGPMEVGWLFALTLIGSVALTVAWERLFRLLPVLRARVRTAKPPSIPLS